MGRNASRRAQKHQGERPHGLAPEEEKQGDVRDRCPRCGSTHLVTMQRVVGVSPYAPGADVVCLNCNWQGRMGAGY
jgi:hypothetical protein